MCVCVPHPDLLHPTGLLDLQAQQIYNKKKTATFMWYSNDMFHYYLFKAELATLASLNVSSGSGGCMRTEMGRFVGRKISS